MLLTRPARAYHCDPQLRRHERTNNSIDRFCAQFFELRAFSLGLENPSLQARRTWGVSTTDLRQRSVFRFQNLRCALLDRHEQPLPRQTPVAHLRARVLHCHAETSRAMAQGNRGCYLIYVLPARAGRTSECLLQFIFRKASHVLPSFCVAQRPVNVRGGSTVSEPTSNDGDKAATKLVLPGETVGQESVPFIQSVGRSGSVPSHEPGVKATIRRRSRRNSRHLRFPSPVGIVSH